jgi:hypothetical protein
MAGATPTKAELLALIAMLQAQVAALTAMAPAATAAPPVGAAPVVFADTPQMLGANDLIDFSAKRGSAIFEQGLKALEDKALTNDFVMTPDQTIIFVEAFHHHATMMNWNQGTKHTTTFVNSAGCSIDIIKSYSQFDEAPLKAACERFLQAWAA